MSNRVNQMQKVKSVIKNIILFSIFLVSANSSSQKIEEGIYQNGNNPAYVGEAAVITYFKFDNKGLFKRKTVGEFGIKDYGKGHYYVKNDSLVLNYNLTELKTESYHKLKKYYNSKDSLQIKLKIYNFNGKVVPDANFQVYKFPDYSTADVNNKNVFILKNKKKTKERINVIIEALGYDRHDIYLDADKSYDIEVFMAEIEDIELPRAYKGDVVKFKVVEITNDYIKLKNKDGKTVIWTKQKE